MMKTRGKKMKREIKQIPNHAFLFKNARLANNRSLWSELEDLRSLREWSLEKTEYRIIPPLPFTKPKRHYISLILP